MLLVAVVFGVGFGAGDQYPGSLSDPGLWTASVSLLSAPWLVLPFNGLLFSNKLNIGGGLVTGPLYGLLGQRWRTRRAWWSAVLVAGALCLEPLAEAAAGHDYPGASVVWPVEVVAGIAVAAYFLVTGRAFRRLGALEVGEPTRNS